MRILASVCAVCILGVSAAAGASAIVDRGLPTENLNNQAGSDRSNVAWAFNGDFTSGDQFALPELDAGNRAWRIDSIRMWTVAGDPGSMLGDSFSSVSLFLGGTGGGALTRVANAGLSGNSTDNADVTVAPVNYPDTDTDYQRGGGSFAQIFQIDFLNLGLFGPGGYYFSADGASDTSIWFNHASNAALSGSPQDGADDFYHWFAGSADDTSISFGGTFDSAGNGWDKSSDINIQVSATQVPLPATALLLMIGLGGLGLSRLSRRQR